MFYILIALALGTSLSLNQNPPVEVPSLQCDNGPLHKTFGGHPWLVYACSDGASIVLVSAQGNPASLFYFMLLAKDGQLSISGEGNGSQAASSSAFDELKRLTPADVALLFEAAAAR